MNALLECISTWQYFYLSGLCMMLRAIYYAKIRHNRPVSKPGHYLTCAFDTHAYITHKLLLSIALIVVFYYVL